MNINMIPMIRKIDGKDITGEIEFINEDDIIGICPDGKKSLPTFYLKDGSVGFYPTRMEELLQYFVEKKNFNVIDRSRAVNLSCVSSYDNKRDMVIRNQDNGKQITIEVAKKYQGIIKYLLGKLKGQQY